jgi:hypothetical protein
MAVCSAPVALARREVENRLAILESDYKTVVRRIEREKQTRCIATVTYSLRAEPKGMITMEDANVQPYFTALAANGILTRDEAKDIWPAVRFGNAGFLQTYHHDEFTYTPGEVNRWRGVTVFYVASDSGTRLLNFCASLRRWLRFFCVICAGKKCVVYAISQHQMTLKEGWIWDKADWEDAGLLRQFQNYLEYLDARRLLDTVLR